AFIAGLRNMVQQSAELAVNISRAASRLGLGTTQMQAFQAAANGAGVQSEELTAALSTMQQQVTAAATDEALTARFKEYGIMFKDTEGNMLSMQEITENSFAAISRIEDPIRRNAAAMLLMGEDGLKMAAGIRE